MIWDAETGSTSAPFPDITIAVTALAFSPDGRRLVVGQLRQARSSLGHGDRPDASTPSAAMTDSSSASPSAPTACASPRSAKVRRCASGRRRPGGRCSASAGTPT